MRIGLKAGEVKRSFKSGRVVSVWFFSQLCNTNTLVINSARQTCQQSQVNAFCISDICFAPKSLVIHKQAQHVSCRCYDVPWSRGASGSRPALTLLSHMHTRPSHPRWAFVWASGMLTRFTPCLACEWEMLYVSDDSTSANVCQMRAFLACGDMRLLDLVC